MLRITRILLGFLARILMIIRLLLLSTRILIRFDFDLILIGFGLDFDWIWLGCLWISMDYYGLPGLLRIAMDQ